MGIIYFMLIRFRHTALHLVFSVLTRLGRIASHHRGLQKGVSAREGLDARRNVFRRDGILAVRSLVFFGYLRKIEKARRSRIGAEIWPPIGADRSRNILVAALFDKTSHVFAAGQKASAEIDLIDRVAQTEGIKVGFFRNGVKRETGGFINLVPIISRAVVVLRKPKQPQLACEKASARLLFRQS